MTDIVLVSLEAWDAVWRRNQHLTHQLLRLDPSLRVLFVEPAADPVHQLRLSRTPVATRGAGLRPGPEAPGRLWLFQGTKWLPRRLDARADDRIAAAIIRSAHRLGMTDPLLWVNDPDGVAVARRTRWRCLYDITDDWTLAERPERERARIREHDAALLSLADEVIVCSPALVTSKSTTRPVTLVPNAVDLAAFAVDHARPADLPTGPVALYLGTVHPDRMDLELTARTSRELAAADGRLVLVGPAPLAASGRHRLVDAGVVLLGPRPAPSVPAYLLHADVLVVPHVRTPFTESLDPIKRYEYLAARRPVVSTPVAGFRELAGPGVTICDPADFPSTVRAALFDAERRAPAVPIPDWGLRAREVHERIGVVTATTDR
ncbi:MAG: glycosyltransferase [Tetrasphaera sp.]